METKTFLDRIKEGEGLFQEFKESFERIDRTMVAFANAKGGIIYLGVKDDGEILSFRLTNSIRARIEDIARNIDPPLRVECRDLGDAAAIVIAEGEDKPYRCADGFFLRVGATNQKLTRDEILDLALRVNRMRYESLQEPDFHHPRDFAEVSLSTFVSTARLERAVDAMGPEDFLISLGIAERQRGRLIFNHAGILFFAKDPQKWIPQAKLSYARYGGKTKTHVTDRMIFTGTLPQQLDEAFRRLSFDVPVFYRLADRDRREEIPAYPLRAIEEALTNALLHRDYCEGGAEITVDHYQDRIEIANPGELLGNLTVENIGRRTIRRNPLIGELFYRLGKGEKLGSGIARMQALMHEWKLKPPRFESGGRFFSVTFFGPGPPVSEEKLLLLPSRPRQFAEMRNQIDEPFPADRYAGVFHVSTRTAQKDLQTLIDAGIVAREGQGKGTRYRWLKS